MDKKKLEEAADIASDNAVFDSHPWNVYNDGFIKGAEWLQSQPIADRLTEDEREKIRELYNEYHSHIFHIELELIFGNEMFEK